MQSDDRAGDAAVRSLLERAVAAGLIPGAVSAWQVGEGPLHVVAAGSARLRPARQPARGECHYDLASLTKPLATTTLVLLARRLGLVDLETSLDEVLSEAAGAPAGTVRLSELLCHSAGLPAWAPLYAHVPDGDRDAVLEWLLGRPLSTRGRVVYSDLGFALLGLTLERLLGEPLGSAFGRLVAAPLGCENAIGYRPDPERVCVPGAAESPRVERAMTGEAGFDPALVPPQYEALPDDGNARLLGGVAGHAGLFGTAAAVVAVARQYLAGSGTLLSDAEIAAVNRPAATSGPLVRSAGWQLAASPRSSAGPALPPNAFGHTGFTGASVWVDPRRRAVLALLSNRHHPAHRGSDLHPLRRRFHALVLAAEAREGT